MSQIVPQIPVAGSVNTPADIAEKIGAGRVALTITDVLSELNSHFTPTTRGALKLASDLLDAKPAPVAGDDGSPSMLPQRAPGGPRGLLPALAPRTYPKPEADYGRKQPDMASTIDALSEAERDAFDTIHARIDEAGVLDVYIGRNTRSADGRFVEALWSIRVADIDGERWVSVQGVRLDQVVSEVVVRWTLGQFDSDPFADEIDGDDEKFD